MNYLSTVQIAWKFQFDITSNVLLWNSTMTWLNVTEYLCHKWPGIFPVCRNHNPVLSSFMTYHRMCNKNYTTGSQVEQELLTIPEHMNSPPVFLLLSGSCCSIFSFPYNSIFLHIIICPFSFGHCIVNFSAILRFTATDCGLFWYLQAFYAN